jgi:hypothetical protein
MASWTVFNFGIFTKKRQNIKFVAKYFKNDSRPQKEGSLEFGNDRELFADDFAVSFVNEAVWGRWIVNVQLQQWKKDFKAIWGRKNNRISAFWLFEAGLDE